MTLKPQIVGFGDGDRGTTLENQFECIEKLSEHGSSWRQMKLMRNAISSGRYQLQNIFNMDETALFYRSIPNRTYLLEGDDVRQSGKGTKMMKANDRLTTILTVNAAGTCKVTPVVIGSRKKARCFRRNTPVLPYYHQKNAWCDSMQCNRWFKEVFLPCIHQWTSEPVALPLDGFSGHDIDSSWSSYCF